MKITSTLSIIGLAATLLASSAIAADVKWDMANEYQETSIHGQAQKVFTDAAMEASGGSIEITNHFGGSIGYKSKEHFDAVARTPRCPTRCPARCTRTGRSAKLHQFRSPRTTESDLTMQPSVDDGGDDNDCRSQPRASLRHRAKSTEGRTIHMTSAKFRLGHTQDAAVSAGTPYSDSPSQLEG